MAVYKRAYAGYDGEHTLRWSRFLVLARFSVRDIFASRFFTVMYVLCFVPFLIEATLVSPDLTNGALPLYLSRPFSRREYVMGKSAVLGGLISVLVWVPILLLFLLNVALAPASWLAQNYWIAGSIVASGLLWALFLCLLSLALSAWVRWRVLATLLTFMIFFLPPGFGTVFNVVLRTNWGNLINFFYLAQRVFIWLFGLQDPMAEGTPPPAFGRPTPAP